MFNIFLAFLATMLIYGAIVGIIHNSVTGPLVLIFTAIGLIHGLEKKE